jgi:hypothetical protein
VSTVHSQRLGADLHLGKQDARPPSSDHVAMSDLMGAIPAGALPPIPQHFGHGYDFGRDGWLMLGNGPDPSVAPNFQGCGDCAWAGPAHETMEAARNARRPVPAFSGKTIVSQYSAYSGYDPTTGANDNGSDVQAVLAWRQSKGLLDDAGNAYRIGKTVTLTPGDMAQLWAATYLFECVGIGVQLQAAQMDQFDAGQPWDYVAGSAVDGGHYIPVMGDNGLISWGERVGFTPAFIAHCCDEAYAYVDPERYSTVTGRTAEGIADIDIERYIVAVAQVKTAA